MTKTVHVAQTRWIGGCEWTNGIYVGETREAVEAAILADENEIVRENNEGIKEGDTEAGWIAPFESFGDLASETEFYVDVWEMPLLS